MHQKMHNISPAFVSILSMKACVLFTQTPLELCNRLAQFPQNAINLCEYIKFAVISALYRRTFSQMKAIPTSIHKTMSRF